MKIINMKLFLLFSLSFAAFLIAIQLSSLRGTLWNTPVKPYATSAEQEVMIKPSQMTISTQAKPARKLPSQGFLMTSKADK